MSRLMSVALTEQAVVERRKTVTRRLGWKFLKPGDQLTLCRKVQGRRRADGTVEPLVRLAEVEVVSVRREPVWDITDEDIVREGVDPGWFEEHYTETGQPTPQAWITWFCEQMDCLPETLVTRIEWRYLEQALMNHDDCAGMLRDAHANSGTDVTVSEQPPPVITELAKQWTCPHGVALWVTPTFEQCAAWVAEEAS